VRLFLVAALVLFGLAAVSCFGWLFEWTHATDLGLVAAGLFFYVASSLDPSPTL
jgi:hypothetical protein